LAWTRAKAKTSGNIFIGETLDALLDSIAHYKSEGYKAIRVQCGIPGMPEGGYATGKGGDNKHFITEYAKLPDQELWDSEKYLKYMPRVFEAIRDRFGPDLKILHDVHHRLRPREAAAFGKEIEKYNLFWMEDPTPADDQAALKLIRHHTTVPIAIGEVFNSIWDCKTMIEEEWIDFIRVSATYAGGITHLRRIIDLAGLHNVRTGFHGAPSRTAECDALFPSDHYLKDGMFYVSDAPGLGVDFSEREAKKYSFDRRYHPIVRLEDGTMWNY